MLRNQWPDKIGMGGRILSESLAGSPRNTHTCDLSCADHHVCRGVLTSSCDVICGFVLCSSHSCGNTIIIAFPKNSNACSILFDVQRHQLRFCRSFSSASLMFFAFDFFLSSFDRIFYFVYFLFDIARSSQINAYKGIDLKTAPSNIHCTSPSGCITEPNWKSRFCYHLYYQRIIHTYRTYTARHSYMTMGLVAEVVVHLTFGRRSFPTIPTSQT